MHLKNSQNIAITELSSLSARILAITKNYVTLKSHKVGAVLACEQALSGALAARREKEGELATASLEFEYLHRKSRREMLIGGHDISNDVIILDTCC